MLAKPASIDPLRGFVSLLATVLLIVLGVCVGPHGSAHAAQCVLGPSLGAAARLAGISCPEGIGGDSDEFPWGASVSECVFGWNDANLPPGFMNYINGGTQTAKSYPGEAGSRNTRVTAVRDGHKIGDVSILTKSDLTFTMAINIWGRDGNYREYAYFNCRTSSDGAMYYKFSDPSMLVMPVPGTSTPPAGMVGKVATRGSLAPSAGGKYLLRLEVTNTGTTSNNADVFLDLRGYSVESFPVLFSSTECVPNQGLVCSIDWIAPGQTVSTWILLRGDGATSSTIDVSVTNLGYEKVSDSFARGPVNRPSDVTNMFRLARA